MSDYLSAEYSKDRRPYTAYPEKLCAWLFRTFRMKAGMKMLEAGCGRGEFLSHFKNLGLEVCGIDASPAAAEYVHGIPVSICDIEKERIPFDDESFDIVYSKSLIEHFIDPEKFVGEAYRVLKPGGMLLTLVPDWESNYKIYFDDYTHRTPFSTAALELLYRVGGLEGTRVMKFRQLPIVWEYPALNMLCSLIAPFVPVRTKTPFLRWSRELMLAGIGRKPEHKRS